MALLVLVEVEVVLVEVEVLLGLFVFLLVFMFTFVKANDGLPVFILAFEEDFKEGLFGEVEVGAVEEVDLFSIV